MKAKFSPATARLLRPLNLDKRDRLELSASKDLTKFNAQIFSLRPESNGNEEILYKKVWASYPAYTQFPKRILERKKLVQPQSGVEHWQFAATDYTTIAINELWPADQICFANDAAKILYGNLLLQTEAQDICAHTTARWRERNRLRNKYSPLTFVLGDGRAPKLLANDYEINAHYPLAEYQKVALHNCMISDSYCLFMEQGTGKTPVAIEAICNRAKKYHAETGKMARILIAVPKNVRANWLAEFDKFTTQPGKITILRGGQIDRVVDIVKAFSQSPDEAHCTFSAIICSYESVVRSWGTFAYQCEKEGNFNLVILDESHYIKSTRAKRTKKAWELRDISDARLILTGTPITNTPLDLYAQFEFLGKGVSGFNSEKNFRNFYGKYITITNNGDARKILVDMQNMPFIKEKLARYAFIVLKEEVLKNLPDKVYDVCECNMSPQQWDVYEKIRDQLMVQIEDDLDKSDNKELTVNNVLTKLLRLAQVTAGHIKWDAQFSEDGSEVSSAWIERFDPNPKIEALVKILKEKGKTDKTIIWSCWVQDIKTIAARLKLEGIDAVTFYGATSDDDRALAEKRFNTDPECKVFIGNPAAGGVGLNLLGYDHRNQSGNPAALETNCNHEIYISQNWSPTARSQSEDRAHRRGTREPVRITDLVVPKTIDEEIRLRVLHKRQVALEISDVRGILSSILKGKKVGEDD